MSYAPATMDGASFDPILFRIALEQTERAIASRRAFLRSRIDRRTGAPIALACVYQAIAVADGIAAVCIASPTPRREALARGLEWRRIAARARRLVARLAN